MKKTRSAQYAPRWRLVGNRWRLVCNQLRLVGNRWRLVCNRLRLVGNRWQLWVTDGGWWVATKYQRAEAIVKKVGGGVSLWHPLPSPYCRSACTQYAPCQAEHQDPTQRPQQERHRSAGKKQLRWGVDAGMSVVQNEMIGWTWMRPTGASGRGM